MSSDNHFSMRQAWYTIRMQKKKRCLLIKFGGSLITDKTVEKSYHAEVIEQLATSIRTIRKADPERAIIIGHGQGSFAHYPAKKYRLNEGLVSPESTYGLALTLDVVAQLNRIIVASLLSHELPAASLSPSQVFTTTDGIITSAFTDTFLGLIERGVIPVLTGDVLLDKPKGCSIWSADAALPYFARLLTKNGWQVEKIVHVTKTPGVYKDINHPELGTFDVITPKSFAEITSGIEGSHGVDVTGGMLEKVRESVALAVDGIDSVIINNDDNALERVVIKHQNMGTGIMLD